MRSKSFIMKNFKSMLAKWSVMAVAVAGLSSCMVTQAGMGGIYTNVKQGEGVTSNSRGSKVGTSKANAYVGIIAVGDASIEAAAKSAGITKISHVDSQKKSILGIVSSTTTVVYGE